MTFVDEGINFVGRVSENNGIKGKIAKQIFEPNEAHTITATVIGNYKYVKYQREPYYTSQNINKLIPKFDMTTGAIYYLITHIYRFVSLFDGQQGGYKLDELKKHKILLPIKDDRLALSYMENYIKVLENERIESLNAYLLVTNLKDYELSEEERSALSQYASHEWGLFNLKNLFGNATRGRRLKSSDRIYGTLPFVTAGETDTGISAFIGNDVTVFLRNTITIDMFGSAKYRNYNYGADDHVAVVHTEKLSKWSNLFLTTCIHNVANSGKFSYSRNFYAKDADELNILLPVEDGEIDYNFMNCIGRAIEKMVIKDVVQWSDKRLEISKKEKNNV